MMDDAETALKALGMPDKTIHLERFNTPGTRVKRSVNVQSDGQKVTVRQDGRDRETCLMPTMKAFSMRHCARGGSALCLQRRRLCDLQMQSAAWQSGDGNQLQSGTG